MEVLQRDSDHFAGELVCTFEKKKRKPFEV